MKKTPKELALDKVLAFAKKMGFTNAEPTYWGDEGEERTEPVDDLGCGYQPPEQVFLGVNLRSFVWSALPEGSSAGIVAETREELDREIRKLDADKKEMT